MKLLVIIYTVIILNLAFCNKDKSCHDPSLPCTETSLSKECENPQPEAVECPFVNLPQNLTHIMTIAPESEAGERIVIKGKLFESDGSTPYPNVILYAYQTNAEGFYPKHGNETGIFAWHGYLHSWCITNQKGEYEIHTIRPSRYPSNEFPAHIHANVKQPDCHCTTSFICDFVFSDDSLVNSSYLNSLNCHSDNGVITLQADGAGGMTGIRNIVLAK